MSFSRIYRFLTIAIALLAGLLLLEAMVMNTLSYDTFIRALSTALGQSDKLEDFRAFRFRREVFVFHRWFSVLSAAVWWLIGWQMRTAGVRRLALHMAAVVTSLRTIRVRVGEELRKADKAAVNGWSLVLGGYAVVGFLRAASVPIYYDEAWTYLEFTRHGFLTTATWYPMPNNHILFSLLTCAAVWFPPASMFATLQIRAVSILAAVAFGAVFGYGMRQVVGDRAAIGGTAITLSLFGFAHYAIQARGYTLLAFFVAVAAYSVWRTTISGERRRYRVYYTLAAVAGFYTMPTFLYPFLSLHALLALGALWQVEMSRYERLREWVADSLRIATGVWVCYFPVFLLNGVAAVVANDTVRRLPPAEFWAKLPEHIANTCNFLTGVTADTLSGESCVMGGFVGLLALAAWHRSRLKSASAYLYVGAAWLLVTPLLWLAFHRVVPFERTWVYLTLPLGIALTGVLGLADGVVFSWRRQLNPNIGYSVLLALVLVVLGIETTQFSEQYDRLHNEDYELGTALARMPEGEDVRIYTNFWWTQTTVEYELATKGKTHIQGLDTEDSYNATNVYTLVILERGRATDQAVRFTTDPAYRLLLKGHRADFYYYSK